jgi:hypothetical protein
MVVAPDPAAKEPSMPTVTLDLPCRQAGTAQWAAIAFAASYSSSGTRQAYATQLRLWFDWCTQHQLEPLADVRRPHVELYGNVNLIWPHRADHIWPHLGSG